MFLHLYHLYQYELLAQTLFCSDQPPLLYRSLENVRAGWIFRDDVYGHNLCNSDRQTDAAERLSEFPWVIEVVHSGARIGYRVY